MWGDRRQRGDHGGDREHAGAGTAVEDYRAYVVGESEQLVEETELFTEAVVAGDVEAAQEQFGPAREHWVRTEPIAASLGDPDPAIDAREGDVPEEEWTGFPRIEKALWEENTTEGQEEYARRLQADVERIQEQVEGAELQPRDLVTGSVELLNEVSAGKITGEENRYSHTDLYDINANIGGSEAAFEALRPALEERTWSWPRRSPPAPATCTRPSNPTARTTDGGSLHRAGRRGEARTEPESGCAGQAALPSRPSAREVTKCTDPAALRRSVKGA